MLQEELGVSRDQHQVRSGQDDECACFQFPRYTLTVHA